MFPDPARYPIGPWREVDAGDDMAQDVAIAGAYAFIVGGQSVDHVPGVDTDVFVLAIAR